MTFTISMGWWLAPALVTILFAVVAGIMRRGMSGSDSLGMGRFFAIVTWVICWFVPSLIAWFVWALMR